MSYFQKVTESFSSQGFTALRVYVETAPYYFYLPEAALPFSRSIHLGKLPN